MSDDDSQFVKKKKIIHYGSLQPQEIIAPLSSNINISNKYFDLQPESLSVDKQSALEEFERKRKARQIAVSTDDIEVRAHLRHLNQPMCMSFLSLLR